MMQKRVYSIFFALLAAVTLASVGGCSKSASSNEERLIGTWKLDMNKMLEDQEMSEQERAMAKMFMSQITMTMTFNDDGTVDMHMSGMGQEENESGKWEAVSEDGDTITIAAVEEGKESKEKMVITFLDDDTISMKPEGGSGGMTPGGGPNAKMILIRQ